MEGNFLLLLLCCLIYAGSTTNASSYDYSFNSECLKTPEKPQYSGGIVKNPEFNEGTKGWASFGGAKIEARSSEGQEGNSFIVASARNHPYDSFSHQFHLQGGIYYTLSAWIQLSNGSEVPVRATIKTLDGYKHAGWVMAKCGCWSMLKGGFTVDSQGPALLYFESNATTTEIWGDSISLQPFTEEQWTSHQQQTIEKARKSRVKLQATDAAGKPLSGANITLSSLRLSFPFGSAINSNILTNRAYANWFADRGFTVATFENEMKWYANENSPGAVDYADADALLAFAQSHGVAIRGHNVFWDDPRDQPSWVPSLSPSELAAAADKRQQSVMTRYAGKVIGWDVVNENVHFSFFESKLGEPASGKFYRAAFGLDGKTTMFMNDFNTLEDPRDSAASPAMYLKKLKEVRGYPGNQNGAFGIGLEGHFVLPPNIPYMRSVIDTLAAAGAAIWVTELDFKSSLDQAGYLEQVLRELHAHPGIQGIVLWTAWSAKGCYQMCLTDNNFKNLPTGDVVDKLIREWGTDAASSSGTTDSEGFFETSLFHGEYQVDVSHPAVASANSSFNSKSFTWTASDDAVSNEKTLVVKLNLPQEKF